MNINKKTETLLQMIKEDPLDPFLYFALAKEHEKSSEIDLALKSYAHLVEHHTDYVGTYYHYGQLLSTHISKEKALKVFNQGITIARNQGDQHSASELMNAKMNIELEE